MPAFGASAVQRLRRVADRHLVRDGQRPGISPSLSPGQRLWFEQGVLAGDTVLVPHEVLSDTPAFLALPRLRRRFRCTAREAAGLADLFLALDASPAVVAHYDAEARRLGVGAVLEELVGLVVQLALVEQVPGSPRG